MRLTEARLRQIIKEEVRKVALKESYDDPDYEAWVNGELDDQEDEADADPADAAWTALSDADLEAREMELDRGAAHGSWRLSAPGHSRAFRKLGKIFAGSPTPALDIADFLRELGYDEDRADEVGEIVQMKWMD